MHRMALVEAERALEHWAVDEDSLEGQGAVIWHTAQVLLAHGRSASSKRASATEALPLLVLLWLSSECPTPTTKPCGQFLCRRNALLQVAAVTE